MPSSDHREALAHNLESWEKRTPIHLRAPSYRHAMSLLRSGKVALEPPTDVEIGDVAGQRVLHLQCHIGLDTLSLVRLGADATGLDFSPAAVAAARGLSAEFGLPARFVLGDAQKADETLRGEAFDLVFASIGSICWIPDLLRWVRSAANLLKPGGVLYVADSHPILDVFEDDPQMPYGIDFKYGYFRTEGLFCEASSTYADDGSGQKVPATIQYTHTLGEVVTSVAQSGLVVEYLHEFAGGFDRRFQSMIEKKDGLWDFPDPLVGKLPSSYSLRAHKPG